jgi:outer membrane protein TolC
MVNGLPGRTGGVGFAAFVAAALLAGCSAPPRADPPASLPAAWANWPGGGDTAAGATGPEFWRRLGDGRLAALVGRSLSGSPSVTQAVERVAAARATEDAAAAGLLPGLSVGGNARIRRTLRGQSIDTGAFQGLGFEAGSLTQPRTSGVYEAGFDASWELGLFGRREATLTGAAVDRAFAEAEVAAARTSLASEVGRTYAALRAAEAREELLLGVAASQDRLLALVRTRRAAGLASDLDVERAAVSPDRSRAAAAEATAATRRALQRLAVLAGEPSPDARLLGGSGAASNQPRVPPGLGDASRRCGARGPPAAPPGDLAGGGGGIARGRRCGARAGGSVAASHTRRQPHRKRHAG